MSKFILLLGFVPCILLAEYHFQCVFQPNAHTTVTTYFTDAVPEFYQIQTVKDGSGKIVSQTKKTFISPSEICSIPTQFKTGCNTHVMTEGNDFNYSFRCDDAFGDLVFLESSSYAQFRCQGETVPSYLNELTFENCTSK